MPVNTAPREASPDDLARASPSGPGTAFRWPARLWIVLLVSSGVILLDGLDVSMIVVAIPQIQREFGLSAATAQWLAGAYILAFGSFLLLGGRCADLFGRRRMLVQAKHPCHRVCARRRMVRGRRRLRHRGNQSAKRQQGNPQASCAHQSSNHRRSTL